MAPCPRSPSISSAPYTEFGEHRIGVLPESGHRAHRSLVAGDDGRWQQGLNRAGRCVDLPPTVARRQLRVDQNFAGQVVARIADPGGVRRFLHVVQVVRRAPGADGLVQDVAMRAATGVVGEPRVVGEVVARNDLS